MADPAPDAVALAEESAGCIVVGHDGSRAADAALRFAAQEARLRGDPLLVVRAWSITSAPRPAQVEPGVVPTVDEFADAVRDELAADVARVLDDPAGAEVRLRPVHARASEALVAASRDAVLTVVGTRGLGTARDLLGSTSAKVLDRATGPILVVRA